MAKGDMTITWIMSAAIVILAGFLILNYQYGWFNSINMFFGGTVDCASGLIFASTGVMGEDGMYGVCAPDCSQLRPGGEYTYMSVGAGKCKVEGETCCLRVGTGENAGTASAGSRICTSPSSHPCYQIKVDAYTRVPGSGTCVQCQENARGDPLLCIVRPAADSLCPAPANTPPKICNNEGGYTRCHGQEVGFQYIIGPDCYECRSSNNLKVNYACYAEEVPLSQCHARSTP